MLYVVFSKNKTKNPIDDSSENTSTISGTIDNSADTNSNDGDNNQINDTSDSSSILSQSSSSQNNTDNSQSSFESGTVSDEKNVINYADVKYPKEKMQPIIDNICRANTALNKVTGEDVFEKGMDKLSTVGTICYISEYGKNGLFKEKVSEYGDVQAITYPDTVIIGFAFFMGGRFETEEIPKENGPGVSAFRSESSKMIVYKYPTEDIVVNDTFEYISSRDSGDFVIMKVAGKGKYAGSEYEMKVISGYPDLWAIESLTKLN